MSSRTLAASLATLTLAAATLGVAAAGAAVGDSGRGHDQSARGVRDLVRTNLVGSLVSDPPVFGVAPGGAPWDLRHGTARVRADGRTTAEVDGLLIPGVGVGPVRTVTLSLACNGAVVDTTDPAPLSTAGDASIRDHLTVPARCVAPMVFVNPNGNRSFYIAIAGRQR